MSELEKSISRERKASLGNKFYKTDVLSDIKRAKSYFHYLFFFFFDRYVCFERNHFLYTSVYWAHVQAGTKNFR